MEDYLEAEEDTCNFTEIKTRNCSTGGEDISPYPAYPTNVIVPVVLGVVFIVGVGANVMLLLFVLQKKRRKSPHIILIASLAASDLSMLVIGMPFVSTIYTLEDWPFGNLICKLSEFAQTLSASAAVLNLTALSADRYFTLAGTKSHPSQKSPLLLVTVIWVTSTVFALPDLFSSTILEVGTMEFCIVYPESLGILYSQFHITLKLLYLFILPLMAIGLFYILIVLQLTRNTELIPATNSQLLGNHQHMASVKTKTSNQRKRIRLTVIILGLVVVFVVTWLPRHVYLMWHHFDTSEYTESWYVFKIIGFCLMFTNSLFNPFLYGALDTSFRRFLSRVLKCNQSSRCVVREVDSDTDDNQQMTMTVLTQHLNSTENV